jgi:outer membrane protein assembly factor BamA
MKIKPNHFNAAYLFGAAIIILLSAGCSATKKVPANDALYTGATLKFQNYKANVKRNKVIKDDLQALIRPRPNSRILGIPFKLLIYNMAGKKNNFINRFLRRTGEPPVLLSQVNVTKNVQVLTNTLENKGFFHAKTTGDTIVKNKKASARYVTNTGVQYTINQVSFQDDTSALSRAMRDVASKSILKKGDAFSLDAVKGERLRIDADLKERGFYYFNPDDLIVLVDSTIGRNQANLFVKLKPEVPEANQRQYTINNIYIYSNYNLNTAKRDTLKSDTVFYKGYYVIDRKKTYRPQVFEQMMRFESGELYNRAEHNLTINRLINLSTFKFVKNRFEQVPDSFKLNTYYYLTPLPRKALSAEVGWLSRSNNVTGSEVTLRWRNRNAFRGAELVTFNIYGGFEVQYSGQFSGYNTYRTGAEANLTFPRFLIPFFRLNTQGSFVPRTSIQLGYDILQRQKLYTLNSYRAQFGYNWKESTQKEHQFNPISINYVQALNVTDSFSQYVKNYPTLQRTISKQFIIGSNYNFNYNQLVGREKNAGGLYFNGLVDLSGNLLGLITGADVRKGKSVKLFGTPFSQYAKVDFDTRYYIRTGTNSQWANRLLAGVGLPYGNDTILPFVKQFFVGGSNSLRGFRSRSVGPGTYGGGQQPRDSSGILPDMTGDIRLEFNTEYRAKLFSIVNGAVFIDAGNVWLYHDNPDKPGNPAVTGQPGAKFTKNFMKQLAIDAGVGLRVDVTILLIRFDVAIPIRKPWLPEGERNVINQIDFGSSAWRRQNIVYNIAIGLPF